MKSNIFIPKKINVGYQNRSDTYTKKLAYVIYYDEKGKLRKETSWNSWRDDKIEPQEFDNEPTSGFVLNKKVGDYSNGWDHRQAYVRIYDPRNFEFEITVENLLYILENTSAIKGKGLEGDFVYGWDGKDLILIPTSSPDYEQLAKYNDILHNAETIKAKDLITGGTYMTKQNEKYVYIGRYERWDYDYISYKNYDKEWKNKGKEYFFCELDEDGELYFRHMKSINKKIVSLIDGNCISNYADISEKLEHKSEYSPVDDSKDEYIKYTLKEFTDYINSESWWCKAFTEITNGKRYSYGITKKDDGLFTCDTNNRYGYNLESDIETRFRQEEYEDKDYRYYCTSNTITKKRMMPISIEELYEKLQPHYLNKYLANGKFYERIEG